MKTINSRLKKILRRLKRLNKVLSNDLKTNILISLENQVITNELLDSIESILNYTTE